MNAQDRVFGRFPEAVVRKQFVIAQDDAEHLVEESAWTIFAGPEFDAEELGRGRSEIEAWYDAAGLLGNQAA
jgi:hypothetical protein